MPGLSGTKVCKLLKKTLPEAKILLYSSILPATLQPMAAEAGVDAWVSKREPIAKLILTLRKLLAS
jgi:CheY-like chemotaxis protein